MFQWLKGLTATDDSKRAAQGSTRVLPSGRELMGQVAVISGSTSGIGLALAKAAASRGADVVLNGLGDPAEIERERAGLEASCGVRVRYHGADMRQGDEVADLVAYAKHQLGRLDILVNNAGVQHVEAIEKFPADQWERIIAVNLSSVFYATRAAIPIMKAQGRGRIVNIASAHGLTKATALEVATTGITCNAICPGFVETPIVEKQIADQARMNGISRERVLSDVILAKQPTKRFVTTDELAGMFLYLVSDLGASANGAAFSIDGGWTAQ